MKFTRIFALFVAFAFVLCAFVFSPPDVSASQSTIVQKQSVNPPTGLSCPATDFNQFVQVNNTAENIRVIYTSTAPFAASRQESSIVTGYRNYRPPNLHKYGVVGWKLKSKFPKYVRTGLF